MIKHKAPRYLTNVRLDPKRVPDKTRFPFSILALQELELRFTSPVTFFIGENGSGKSTLVEALATLCDLPPGGGGRHDLADAPEIEPESTLTTALFRAFKARAPDAYFFRAERLAHFSTLLEERASNSDFMGDPYFAYGGRSLHTRSHGEAFLAVLENRLGGGLYFMDEPESALSPQRQLHLLAHMADLVRQGDTQFVIATHSPILLTFPGAVIISLDDGEAREVTLEETSHFQLTRDILAHPERYWEHLAPDWYR
jgi:predicted ATPase